MPETTPNPKHNHEKLLRDLLRAQARYAAAGSRFEDAREARDDAIRAAVTVGLAKKTIAQATGLTPGRITQVIGGTR